MSIFEFPTTLQHDASQALPYNRKLRKAAERAQAKQARIDEKVLRIRAERVARIPLAQYAAQHSTDIVAAASIAMTQDAQPTQLISAFASNEQKPVVATSWLSPEITIQSSEAVVARVGATALRHANTLSIRSDIQLYDQNSENEPNTLSSYKIWLSPSTTLHADQLTADELYGTEIMRTALVASNQRFAFAFNRFSLQMIHTVDTFSDRLALVQQNVAHLEQ